MYSLFSSKENVKSREVLPCDPASHKLLICSNSCRTDKSGSDSDGGGGNRLKRNIKHTGSLIVRKFRASRHGGGDAGKKDARSTSTNESAGPSGNAMDNDNEKPNTTQNTTTPMLRTTTL
ncbi:uncharacterized protein LOC124461935 [Drosophila willistoni]|uniref:uncharacterized protein LOC124461935 n=1 Tax=Drosophila willistoni TaxID=7260 RepID=UPI001F073974|nr:uncharacterized protein LOC124461935 [Drosophila willistoni]